MMCHKIGRPPISTIGFGRDCVSSERRVPSPPARITAFIYNALSDAIFAFCRAANQRSRQIKPERDGGRYEARTAFQYGQDHFKKSRGNWRFPADISPLRANQFAFYRRSVECHFATSSQTVCGSGKCATPPPSISCNASSTVFEFTADAMLRR